MTLKIPPPKSSPSSVVESHEEECDRCRGERSAEFDGGSGHDIDKLIDDEEVEAIWWNGFHRNVHAQADTTKFQRSHPLEWDFSYYSVRWSEVPPLSFHSTSQTIPVEDHTSQITASHDIEHRNGPFSPPGFCQANQWTLGAVGNSWLDRTREVNDWSIGDWMEEDKYLIA